MKMKMENKMMQMENKMMMIFSDGGGDAFL